MLIRRLLVLLLILATPGSFAVRGGSTAHAAAAEGGNVAVHPQDGPHADLRIAIEPDGVRFSVGVNLAFIDEIDPIPREFPGAVAPTEADRIRARLERFFDREVVVELDGVVVAPIVDSYSLYNEPDAGMIALYPRMGALALIRCATVLVYPAKQLPDVVRVTWPVYPPDLLGAEMEGLTGPDGGPPRMFIEVQVRGEGVLRMERFSEPEPTIEWRSSAAGGGIVFADVPLPSVASSPAGTAPVSARVPVLGALAAVVAAFGVVSFAVSLARGRRPWIDALVVVVAGGGAFLLRDTALVALPGIEAAGDGTTGVAEVSGTALPTDEEAAVVFAALHENLYRAFDYTDESDVYDALARSVRGPLLERLYTEIYASLVQAEQDNMLGVVTGVEPVEFEVMAVHAADAQGPPRFEVRHRWQVAGTVYHWGHAHTRVIEYDAEYTVSAHTEGWRLTGQTMLAQWRLDPGAGEEFPEEI